MDQDGAGPDTAARCTRCGVLLTPAARDTGAAECVLCLAGPDEDWSGPDDETPPACQDCEDLLLIPEVTVLSPKVAGRRQHCQGCAAIGAYRDCGDTIIRGYNDVPAAAVGRRLCRDCAPDPTGDDTPLAAADTAIDDPIL
ncbi:hypothetical protein [Frankia sp. R82]|uniref:hypothetical protein n=1 Tax=Frankia sp. R82 TaxID=2950553 RepID=UPI002043B485|nr:hypothetical protein [Frankia sp. R82]MCM3886837.1 hypothetical protein [Frankia sp. R82]